MRFESKNAQIKRFVKRSFLNIPLTVSIHHQQWMCHEMVTRPEQTHSNVFYCGDEVTSGTKRLCFVLYVCVTIAITTENVYAVSVLYFAMYVILYSCEFEN